MFIVSDKSGNHLCARCGRKSELTIDHFIPKSCRMTVNNDSNYVGLCVECNREKADRIVLPSWYRFLDPDQQTKLDRMMRYSRSYILKHTEEQEIIEYVEKL